MIVKNIPGLEGLTANIGTLGAGVTSADFGDWIPPKGRLAWYIGINFTTDENGKADRISHTHINRWDGNKYHEMPFDQKMRVINYVRDRLNDYLANDPSLNDTVKLESLRLRVNSAERKFAEKRDEVNAALEELEFARSELDAFDFSRIGTTHISN